MFSSACVKTATETASNSIALLVFKAANDSTPAVPLLSNFAETKLSALSESIVSAERSIDLFILTNEPLSPVADVKILTVMSCDAFPPNCTWVVPDEVV